MDTIREEFDPLFVGEVIHAAPAAGVDGVRAEPAAGVVGPAGIWLQLTPIKNYKFRKMLQVN